MTATVERFVDVMATYADAFVAKVLTEFSPELFTTVTERFAHLIHAIDECLHRDGTAARANRLFLPLFGSARNRGEQIALARRIIGTWHDRAPLHLEAVAVMASVATFGGDTPLAVQLIRRGARRRDRRRPAPVARPSVPRLSRGVPRGSPGRTSPAR